jgi:hypothetical protein
MTSRDAREDRLKWLLRPFNWALGVCIYPVILIGMMWFDSKMPSYEATVILLATLATAAGLILWGIRRVMDATRGRW